MSQTSPVTATLLAGLSRVLRVMESARHPRNSNIMSVWEDDVKAIKAVEDYLRGHAPTGQQWMPLPASPDTSTDCESK